MNAHEGFSPMTEVTRSFSFKLNLGNYQSADFFCSQKSECAFEDVAVVSESLHSFCKKQVLAAVAEVQANGLQPKALTPVNTAGPEQGSKQAVRPSGETRGQQSEEARNDVKSQTGPSMETGNGAPPPPAPIREEVTVPEPVQKMWDRMGASKEKIMDEIQQLRSTMWQLVGDKSNDEYAAIVKQFGDPVNKVQFARRVVHELWKRIQAIHAEQVAAEQEAQGETLFGKKEVAYAD